LAGLSRNPALRILCFSSETSVTASPFRTVELFHFSLMMIFPIAVLHPLVWSTATDAETPGPGKWAAAGRPVRAAAGICTGSAAKAAAER
jgi:hypothetical protein